MPGGRCREGARVVPYFAPSVVQASKSQYRHLYKRAWAVVMPLAMTALFGPCIGPGITAGRQLVGAVSQRST